MSKNTKLSQKRGADLTSYSFTEPVVRVLGDKAKGKSGPHRKIRPSQNAGTKTRVVVFHKRKDKSNDADVLGTRNLSAWRTQQILENLQTAQTNTRLLGTAHQFKWAPSFVWMAILYNEHANFVR